MKHVSIENDQYVSREGDRSSLEKIELVDLDAMHIFDKITHDFNKECDLKHSDCISKVYYKNGELYKNRFNNDNGVSDFSFIDSEKSIDVFEDFFMQDLKYFRLLSVKDFPPKISRRSNLVYGHEFVINYKPIPKVNAKRKLELNRRLHFSSFSKDMKDIESTNAYEECEELLEAISRDETELFDVEMFYLIEANTKDSLDIKTRKLLELYKAQDGALRVESRALSYFIHNSFVGVMPKFKRLISTTTDYLNMLIPEHRDFLYESGIAFNNDVKINLFDRGATNFNSLVTGASGQGKSMLVNKLVFEEVSSGKKAVIVDLGNSYQNVTKYLGGVTRSLNINPLEYRCPHYLKAFILSIMGKNLSKVENGKLFERVSSALGEGISNWDDFISFVEKEFEGIRYYFSEVREYFTSQNSSENDLIYCDFSLYPESMKAPMLIYLLETFKRMNGQKLLVFDECWFLMDQCADYVMECFRTFRKHDASAVAISQSIDDFAENELGRVIIQNCFHKFIFKQQVKDNVFLNKDHKKALSNINSKKGEYSEFLYINDEACKSLRFYPTHLELELFRSDKSGREKFNYYMSEKGRFLDFSVAVNNYVKIKYPVNNISEVNHV